MNDLISRSNTTAKLWQTQVNGGSEKENPTMKLMLRSRMDVTGFINTKEVFKEHFGGEVARVSGSLYGPAAEMMKEIGESGLNQILENAFKPMEQKLARGEKLNKNDVKNLLRQANTEARNVVSELRTMVKEQTGNQNTTPQLVKGTGINGGYNLIRVAPQLENIVLKGGGAKGMGYPGALREMREAGMLDGLKKVAGTSAGALTAVALSVGQSSDDFESLVRGSGLTDMLSVIKPHLYVSYPELSFVNGISQFHAMGLIQKMDHMMQKEVSSFVESVGHEELMDRIDDYARKNPKENVDVQAMFDRVLKLAEEPKSLGKRSDNLVTFNDMKFLHALEPGKFKEITLTGWNSDKKEQVYFKAGGQQGNLPIIYAARISMAHPGIAKGIVLDEKYGLGKFAYQDGGIGSNLPSEVFYEGNDRNMAIGDTFRDQTLQDIRSKTAVLVFNEKGKAYDNMHKTEDKDPLKIPRQIEKRSFSDHVAHTETRKQDKEFDRQKTLASGPNAFVVAHGDLTTMSILAGKDRKTNAINNASELMMEQIDLRRGQAYAVTVLDPSEAFGMLSSLEKEALFRQGAPSPVGMTVENYQSALEFHNLAKDWMEKRN